MIPNKEMAAVALFLFVGWLYLKYSTPAGQPDGAPKAAAPQPTQPSSTFDFLPDVK